MEIKVTQNKERLRGQKKMEGSQVQMGESERRKQEESLNKN